MEPGDTLDLEITGFAHGGVAVARHEGRVVFVSDAIPGERVRARLTETGERSFWRAATVEVVDASPDRRPHVWAAAGIDVDPDDRPGGADLGHIALARQRALKAEVVADQLRRIGRLELPVRMHAPDDERPDGAGWRTRVGLHRDASGRVGAFAARSHRVIETDDLPLATPAVEAAARGIAAGPAARIDLVEPGGAAVRVLERPTARTRGRRAPEPAAAREPIVERVGEREFALDAGGFWQVHPSAAPTLARAVREGVGAALDPDALHLDLYGGVGLFAATLGDLAGPGARIVSVESSPRATAHAAHNLADFAHARAETARVDRWLAADTLSDDERRRLTAGVVLLDPPRQGAGREVVEGVADASPAHVVYVACDPAALARDLGLFAARGYEASVVDAYDLFPHSHHVEAVAILHRGAEGSGRAGDGV